MWLLDYWTKDNSLLCSGHSDVTNAWSFQFPVDRATPHPAFVLSPPNILNDIAIVHLKSPVPLSQGIRPVCLPDIVDGEDGADAEDRALAPDPVTVVGWGRTEKESRPDTLQELDIQVVGRKGSDDTAAGF